MNRPSRPAAPTRAGRWLVLLATLVVFVVGLVSACTDPAPVDPPPPDPGAWSMATPSSAARQEVSYVRVGGKFYLAGGSRLHEVYDPEEGTWTEVAPLPAWRDHIQGVAVDGAIYYIGGIVQWPTGHQDTVFVYHPLSDTFTNGASMGDRGRGAGGVAVHDGSIYYAGGLHDGSAVDWFDVYDPATDTWTTLEPMPHVRDHFQAAVVAGRFYAIGGRDSVFDATIDAVDVYDFETGSWTTLDTALPTPRGGFATAVLGDEILVIGGEGHDRTYDTVEAYDTGSNSWRTLTPLSTGRHGIQAAACNDTVYLAAGGTTQGGGNKSTLHEVFAFDEPQPCPDPLDSFTEIAWTPLPPGPLAPAEAQGALVGDDLYVFGGFRPDWSLYCTTKTSEVLNTTDRTWRLLEPGLPDFWTHTGLVVDGDSIHFAGMRLQGGRTDETDPKCDHWEIGTTEVWTFDTVTKTWSQTLPPLPEGRSSGGFALLGRTLHFFGGSNADTSDEVEDHWVLDLDDLAAGWTDRAPLPNPRNHMGVATLDGRIYAVGGQWDNGAPNVPQDDVHSYDPATDSWAELAPLPTSQSHNAATIAIGDRIVVFGGEQERHGNPVHEVLAYDPEDDTWTALTPLPVDPRRPGFGSRAGVVGFVDGAIYYARGEHAQQAYRGTPVIDW